MSKPKGVCRVLILDDDLDYAVKVAQALEDYFEDSRSGPALRVELSNSAAFVADRLSKSARHGPPWDLILADVFMRRSARSADDPINVRATKSVRSLDGKTWRSWEHESSGNTLPPDIENGGLYLADRIAGLLENGRSMGGLKLVLVSRQLQGADRRRIHELRTRHRDWLDYYDKTAWEDGEVPRTLLSRGAFLWALIQAIRERDRKSWGGSALRLIPENDYFTHIAPSIDALLVEARVRAQDRATRAILISGEPGVGRLALARLVHEIRSVARAADRPFGLLDAWTVPTERVEEELFGVSADWIGGPDRRHGVVDRAAGGSLCVHEISRLPLHVQARLLTLLDHGLFRRAGGLEDLSFDGRLILLTCEEDVDRLVDQHVLDQRLRDRLAIGRLRIPPLRERPDDVIVLAAQALRKSSADKKLTPDAEDWLREHEYGGNVRELFQLVREAALCSPAKWLSANDLDNVSTRRTCNTGAWREAPGSPPDQANLLVREGPDIWRLRFRGGPLVRVSDRKGVEAVAQLLSQPDQWIKLETLENGRPYGREPSSAPPEWALKEAGLSDYGRAPRPQLTRRDARALIDQRRVWEAERLEAERNNDLARLSRAREMLKSIEEELLGRDLSGALVLTRQVTKSTRDRVAQRIKRACLHLESALSGVGDHIQDAIERRPDAFRYCPTTSETWHVVTTITPLRSAR